MQKILRQFAVVGGLIVLPNAAVPVNVDGTFLPRSDQRLIQLKQFLAERESPIVHLAEDFLIAADRHGVDWRLLPAIAMVESSGGKYHPLNNIFGWNNGAYQFESIPASIYYLSERLSTMDYYKDKDLDGVLWTYNPIPGYSDKIKNAMKQIDPRFKQTRHILFASDKKNSRRAAAVARHAKS